MRLLDNIWCRLYWAFRISELFEGRWNRDKNHKDMRKRRSALKNKCLSVVWFDRVIRDEKRRYPK